MIERTFSSECCLFFNHTLFRGNRVSKASSHDLNAFTSPNFPPLVNGKYDADQVLSLATDRSYVTSGNRHRGELERRHQTNQPTQIQSA